MFFQYLYQGQIVSTCYTGASTQPGFIKLTLTAKALSKYFVTKKQTVVDGLFFKSASMELLILTEVGLNTGRALEIFPMNSGLETKSCIVSPAP